MGSNQVYTSGGHLRSTCFHFRSRFKGALLVVAQSVPARIFLSLAARASVRNYDEFYYLMSLADEAEALATGAEMLVVSLN
ncbi:MAG: hypothetical protein AUJ37_04035 [Candidatus Magasanikbacteria bacterium CG1_02_41_34]|uniref:Uncharacterized protein n=1 Tax=Candidatus Magasanikbacteria bacterium CG_4_10_14_0_2_um_filter_41_31 TaxID=1974639 RepID=A0A2M7V1P4_9BACT|nr:MAG: hypothetical protein AUJ37_04035 [Candidatus Magasanikbacteria bacterium CG1_02_41_34]PIZ92266.1 MAG: hypothetical protein COX83_04655 [Candidatus Magasanikbacteria bacterium CG_4_10_14_0_2_um_filter_41_31]